MKRRKVILLGATGSIGASAMRVARALPDRIEIVGLSAHANADGLIAAADEFRPAAVCVSDPASANGVRDRLPGGCRLLVGPEGLGTLASEVEADVVLVAIVGTGGLAPALTAIRAGRDLAVASKEILVMAGEIVMGEAKRCGVNVLPVDSEHNAIFQCLEGKKSGEVERLILTCSGGPFREFGEEDLLHVTPAMALRHPTWEMGRKISIDSATLFNKGLEMIEARWLFDIEIGRVGVVIHPQSIVHSMVEFVDGSVLAQLSRSDMGFPIQYALTWPDRVRGSLEPLDFAALGRLDFANPREGVFPALKLARQAGETGGTLPAVLNAANEVAVEAFLSGGIGFCDIWNAVAAAMNSHRVIHHPNLEQIIAADAEARRTASAR